MKFPRGGGGGRSFENEVCPKVGPEVCPDVFYCVFERSLLHSQSWLAKLDPEVAPEVGPLAIYEGNSGANFGSSFGSPAGTLSE